MIGFVLLFALLNVFRGRGLIKGGRIIACVGFGVAAWLYGFGVTPSIAIALGMFLWCLRGWGNGLNVIAGDGEIDYSENPLLCRIADRLTGFNELLQLSAQQKMVWAFWYMTFRGTYMYPMFITLACLVSWHYALIGLCCLLQGSVYRYAAYLPIPGYRVMGAEFLMGGLVALLLL